MSLRKITKSAALNVMVCREGTYYCYSWVNQQPLPWVRELLTIKEKVQQNCQCEFNGVLLNLYRDGQDSIGYHADDTKELGGKLLIASLSFGAERLFKLNHKRRKKYWILC